MTFDHFQGSSVEEELSLLQKIGLRVGPAPKNPIYIYIYIYIGDRASIWAHQFAEGRLFPASKLTDLYRAPSVSTLG